MMYKCTDTKFEVMHLSLRSSEDSTLVKAGIPCSYSLYLFTDIVLSAMLPQSLYSTLKPAEVNQLFGKCERLTEQGHGIVVHRI